MTFCKGYSQGGSNADIVIADAFVKNLTAGIDWDTAYKAVVSDAEGTPPPPPPSPTNHPLTPPTEEPSNWGVQGRGNLVAWHNLGFIPSDDHDNNGTGPNSRTVSRGVEYAYNDFCISLLAAGLNHPLDAAKYLRRSGNWANYWNPDQLDLPYDSPTAPSPPPPPASPFRGFMQPRLTSGQFKYQNTRTCSPLHNTHACYYDTAHDTYEGSPWLYSFFVPQDMAALITYMGGPPAFVDRLTYFHTSGLSYMGNEQGFLPVFQFHYAHRPALSSRWTHAYIPALFNASANGIPGNDDCAMGAFSAFAMMGFFPVAGQDVYLLTAPFFAEVRVRARTAGRWAVVRTSNFDPERKRIYIQSARLDGRRYSRNWIEHEFFIKGGVLELEVGEEEGKWGTRADEAPLSYPTWEDASKKAADGVGSGGGGVGGSSGLRGSGGDGRGKGDEGRH